MIHFSLVLSIDVGTVPPPSVGSGVPLPGLPFVAVEDRWVQCDRCSKWRRVTDEHADISQEKWFCEMNTWDPARANCQAEEENSEDDDVAQVALQAQNALAQQQQQHQQKKQTKRKKKKGSDDEDEDTSDTNSADEAFYMAIDESAAAGRGRRSGRAVKPPAEFAEYADFDDGEKKKARVAYPWTAEQDDALLSAIVKHGIGAWTNMLKDPEFSDRFADLKAGALRNRWKKLGTSNFDNGAPSDAKTQAKREQVMAMSQETVPSKPPPPPPPAATTTQPLATPTSSATPTATNASQQPTQSPTRALPPGVAPGGPPPSTQPFNAYRPYPTHIFDLPKAMPKKVPATASVKDAADALSTPMDASANRPKKRGRKRRDGDSDDDEFGPGGGEDSDDSDAAEERAAQPEGARDDEFRDLDENLDNIAYMYYYDHRNAAIQLFDTFSIPFRELKKQFTNQYGMKDQDALELIRCLGESPDNTIRRAILSQAIRAHMSHFQTAQLIRQWCYAVRQMTTQHVHEQHAIKLKIDQQTKIAEQAARKAYQEKYGRPMPEVKMEEFEHENGYPSIAAMQSMINPKTGEQYIRGPYQRGHGHGQHMTPIKSEHSHHHATPTPVKSRYLPQPASTPGLAALEKLPYYWRAKLHAAKRLGGDFPIVTGSTPARALLQSQLDEVRAEWDTPLMTSQILGMRVGERALEKIATHAQHANANANANAAAATANAAALAAVGAVPNAAAGVSAGAGAGGVNKFPPVPGFNGAMPPSIGTMPPQMMGASSQAALPASSAGGVPSVAPTETPASKRKSKASTPAKTTGRKRSRKSRSESEDSEEDTDESDDEGQEYGEEDSDEEVAKPRRRQRLPEEDLTGIYLDPNQYPLPNIRLKRLEEGKYAINRIVAVETRFDEDGEALPPLSRRRNNSNAMKD